MIEPQFSIGEKAILRSQLYTNVPVTLVTVLDWHYDDNPHNAIDGSPLPSGYSYKVTPDPIVGDWWFESALHKIPPHNQNSHHSFSEIIQNLKKHSNPHYSPV